MARKPLEQLTASYEATVHSLDALNNQKTMETKEYVNRCINFVPRFASFIETKNPANRKSLLIAAMNNLTLWLAIEDGKPILYNVNAAMSPQKDKRIEVDEAIRQYEPVIESCGDAIDKFLHDANEIIKVKLQEYPTTEQAKEARKAFHAQLANDLEKAAIEQRRLAN